MIITVDGPAASGKGTVCRLFAAKHNWAYLDAGLLYRLAAYAVAGGMPIEYLEESAALKYTWDGKIPRCYFRDRELTQDLRKNRYAEIASKLCEGPAAILRLNAFAQRQAERLGDFICDGRNTGTTMFPAANWKFYLTASIEKRVRRRYQELIERGEQISIEILLEDMLARDARDSNRSESCLQIPDTAELIDSTELSAEACVGIIEQTVFRGKNDG